LEQNKLNKEYWDERYRQSNTGWDIGSPSTPLKFYIDQLSNKDISILIPGCGNAYEAEYLAEKGFGNIHLIDIAPTVVETLQNTYKNNKAITVSLGDFFEHHGQYDLILEQTFFCAIDPLLRPQYVKKMHELLVPNGKLSGLLFGVEFEKAGPPFGGKKEDYKLLFEPYFTIDIMETAYNSIPPRANNELFIKLIKS
jgi:methyl halide transferase